MFIKRNRGQPTGWPRNNYSPGQFLFLRRVRTVTRHLRPVNFYFYDESEPSLVIIWRIGLSCLNLNLKLMYRPPKSNRLSGRICTLSVIQNFLEATQFLQGLPPVSSCPRSDLSQRLSFRHP